MTTSGGNNRMDAAADAANGNARILPMEEKEDEEGNDDAPS
jgi:hypothetical protein